MKRLILTLLLWVIAAPALAQNYTLNVQLTIDSTAAGTSFTATDILAGSGHAQVNSASCTSNSSGGDFRYRVDGTAPTTTVGVLVPAGGNIVFTDVLSLIAFKGIRTAGTSAVLSCTLSNLSEPPVYPVGGGGAGGSGGSVTQGTSPWVVAQITTDPDDASIAAAQTNSNVNGLTMAFNGSTWSRLTLFQSDATNAGTVALATLPGITETSAPTRTNGRMSALSFTAGGAARVMITNAAGTAQTIATDQTFGTSTYTETTTTGPLVGMVRTDTPAALANTTNEVAPLAGSALNGLYTASASNPCDSIALTTLPVSVAADTAVITATASQRVYICGGGLVAAAAEVVNIWEGTGTACGTSSAALIGSTTEANGMSLAANGGFTINTPLRGLSTNVDVCIRLNATNRVAGWLTYVKAP